MQPKDSQGTKLPALLVYDAATEILSGTIGTEPPFRMVAYSGGSRGHKVVAPRLATEYRHLEAARLSSHLATTKEIKDSKGHYLQRGGTLPPGHYRCIYQANHKTFHECIYLRREKDATAIQSPFSPHLIPHGRGNDFFIHSSGPKGSDGCIVPTNKAERLRLNKAVLNFKGIVMLHVKNVGYLLPAELAGQIA